MKRDVRSLLIGLAAEIAIIAVIALVVWAAMGYVNRKLGVESNDRTEDLDLRAGTEAEMAPEDLEVPVVPQDSLLAPDEVEGVELDWEATPCSIYTDSSSSPLMDTLPEAPTRAEIPIELQMVVEAWAEHSGLEPSELEQVYAFSSHDSVYVDIPRRMDFQALVMTLEGRFVCFTRLFPMVGGTQWDRYPSGIHMRGVADGVR